MVSLTIKLPEALKLQVEAKARFSGKSVSTVVREALAQKAGSKNRRKSTLHDRTKDLCGAGASGIPDLATHPRHLKDFGAWRA
jgi:hypothetical protein